MSTTAKEPGPIDGGAQQLRSGRTWFERIMLWVGALSVSAGVIEGALKAISSLYKQTLSITELLHLRGPASWTLLAVIVGLGFSLIFVSKRTRSRLIRPDVLTLRADDPAHLRGRDDDFTKVARLCHNRPLVFLVGESGAGKSALIRAGLCRPGRLPSVLMPVLLDGWGYGWSDGPARRLSEAIRDAPALSEEERANLELAPGARLAAVIAVLKRIKAKLGRTPLLIFDQFDDYQVHHRSQFRDAETGAWKSTDQIASENPFWKGIGELVRAEIVHVLVVTRSDTADGLFAVQFVPDPASYPLLRPSANVVRPLLDDLTRSDAHRGDIVAAPEQGWDQLKERLARDLALDGQVLPIQFRTALCGLASLPNLTVTAYQRAGGIRGLEARSVETLVASAARQSGLNRTQVIQILKAMVDVRDQKTVSKNTDALMEVVQADPAMLGIALATLEASEILRCVPASEHADVSWRLDHDYLCGAVIEVEKRSDRWNVLLRDAHQGWRDADNDLRKLWLALLTPVQQAALLWHRFRNRCRYGAARSYALLSTLRLLPYLVTVLVGMALYDWEREKSDAAVARSLFAVLTAEGAVSDDEMNRCFWPLALETHESVRWYFLTAALETPQAAERLERRAKVVAQAAVGLNADLRERVISNIVSERLSQPTVDARTILGCAALGQALYAGDDHPSFVAAASERLAQAMVTEPPSYLLERLASRLAMVVNDAQPDQAYAVGQRLIPAIGVSPTNWAGDSLVIPFVAIAERIRPAQAGALAERLVQAVEERITNPDAESLVNAFAAIADKVEPGQAGVLAGRVARFIEKRESSPYETFTVFAAVAEHAHPAQYDVVMNRLVQAAEKETDQSKITKLAKALEAMARTTPRDDLEKLGYAIIKAMENDPVGFAQSDLAKAFATVADKVQPVRAGALAERLVQALEVRTTGHNAESLANAFAAIADKVEPGQAGALAVRLARFIEKESHPYLALTAFSAVGKKVQPAEAGALAERLARLVKREKEPYLLAELAIAFASVTAEARPEIVDAVSKHLTAYLNSNGDMHHLHSVARAFAIVAQNADEVHKIAARRGLLKAFEKDFQPTQYAQLGTAFLRLAKDAELDEVRIIIQRLVRVIMEHGGQPASTEIADVIIQLINDSDSGRARSLSDGVAQMLQQPNKDWEHLEHLIPLFEAVIHKVSPAQRIALAQRLARAVEEPTYPYRLDKLACMLAVVAKDVSSTQANSVFRALAAGLVHETECRNSVNEKGRGMLEGWIRTTNALPPVLEPLDLANVLNYPNCTGDLRSAVLHQLATMLQVHWGPKDNPWRIIGNRKMKAYVERPLIVPPQWPVRAE